MNDQQKPLSVRVRECPAMLDTTQQLEMHDEWADEIAALEARIAAAEDDKPQADEVRIVGMYDCHLFHSIKGTTVDEVIENWRRHILEKIPAKFTDGSSRDDLGPSMLCPAVVMQDGKELRRVGQMVFPDWKTRAPRDPAALEVYRQALLNDPDIPRLLKGNK